MIGLSPNNYGQIEVGRPVLHGDEFLSRARQIGSNVVGSRIVSSINQVVFSDTTQYDSAWPVTQTTPTTEQVVRFGDSNDLSMVLVHRSVPPEVSSRYQFGYAAGRLGAAHITTHRNVELPDGRVQRAKVSLPGLVTVLDAMAQDNGLSTDMVPVYFDRVAEIDSPGRGTILGLFPREPDHDRGSRLIQDQTAVIEDRLRTISGKIADLPSPQTNVIPLARVPETVDDPHTRRLIESLRDQLPVRLTLGRVTISSKN